MEFSKSVQSYIEAHYSEITSERWCLSSSLLVPNRVTDQLPVNLICWEMFLQLFLLKTTFFSSLLLPPSPLFWVALLPSNSRWANIYNEIVKCLTFNIWHLLWMKLVYGIFKSMHSASFAFLHSIYTVMEMGLYTTSSLRKCYLQARQ